MQIGIFAKTFPGYDPMTVLSRAAAAGYGTVQYNMACSGIGALPTAIPETVTQDIATAAAKTGVSIGAVSATYNMIHPDMAIRQSGRAAVAAIAGAAKAIGAPMVTVCTGSADAADQWRHHPDNDTPAAWGAMLAEFRAIVPFAERAGITIGVEPELANVVSNASKARRLLDLFPGGPIRIVLDAANLFEAAGTDKRREVIARAIALLGPDIGLAHAKDRDAAGNFATAGQGVIDWDHYIGALRGAGYDGPLITHGLTDADAEATARFLSGRLSA